MLIRAEFTVSDLTIPAELLTDVSFSADFGVITERLIAPDIYTGETEVSPDFTEQTLETKEKYMLDDVTVHAIDVYRVDNTSGGRTVFIGGLFEDG